MFHRILVPLDGSARAEEAFQVARRIAHASGGTLTLLRVVQPPLVLDGYMATNQLAQTGYAVEDEVKRAEAYLTHVLAVDKLGGMGVKTEVRIGTPAQQIMLYAKEVQVDLLVMCSHGATGLQRWVLGSVAQKLARHSPIPVFIVREDHPLFAGSQESATKTLQALVPLDGSPLSEAALQPAAELVAALAAPEAGALHLIRVVELIPTVPDVTGSIAALNEAEAVQAKAYLHEIEQRMQTEAPFASLHLSVSSSVVQSEDVASFILGIAEQGGQMGDQGTIPASAMIAMATHGRTGLARWIMGSIAERILSATTLPMLVVRPEKVPSQPDQHTEAQGMAHMP
ncbi:MAG TPA: universal stress protein [Ktedonobacteraceae bacterium]|jgi:nucleotide-binding universal stress UspA family protein|nr:universal stress protein [Ktedonobacteraceae bacterium]